MGGTKKIMNKDHLIELALKRASLEISDYNKKLYCAGLDLYKLSQENINKGIFIEDINKKVFPLGTNKIFKIGNKLGVCVEDVNKFEKLANGLEGFDSKYCNEIKNLLYVIKAMELEAYKRGLNFKLLYIGYQDAKYLLLN